MFSFEEIDENVVAIALYKIRDVEGVQKAERIILPPPPSMFPSPMAVEKLDEEIETIKTSTNKKSSFLLKVKHLHKK